MSNWLEQNKEWIFSGVGITIILTTVSIFSSLIGYCVKALTDRKTRQILSIKTDKTIYKIVSRNPQADMKVTYKDKLYNNLCEYSVTIRNIGLKSIQNFLFVIKVPIDCSIIDDFKDKSSGLIELNINRLEPSAKRLKTPELIEYKCVCNNLRPSDYIIITYIIDTNRPERIKFDPRSDDIEYDYKGSELTSEEDIKRLILYFALLILFGSIPLIGKILQSLLILVISPTLLRLIKNWYGGLGTTSSVVVQDLTIQEGATSELNMNITSNARS